ncbi:DotA/TraY family protein [Thiotrichales bacterium 19S9-12]|nr:DotA/TraY family protein [Thiotrichales bacterium 19S9-11]MCF6811244.1 DotA/TraY family protein [Thiotrichales bacterium 19S9-12]
MSESVWTIASVAHTDASYTVLQSLFGGTLNEFLNLNYVDDFGNVTGGTLFSTVFYHFNIGLLSIAFLLYAYIVVVGVINTAKDGKMLGKDWSANWVFLRVVLGTVAVIPFKSGYCIAQYLIYAMVLSGISFANYVWQNVVVDVVQNNISPVISPEVSNNINGYFSTYMLSNLVTNMVEAPNLFVNTEDSSASVCSEVYKTVEEEGEDPRLVLSDYKCNIDFTQPVNTQFVQELDGEITLAKSASGDQPFADYGEYLAQGLTSWSRVYRDDYEQYKLDTSDWHGFFTVPQMQDQPTQDNVNQIWNDYNINHYASQSDVDVGGLKDGGSQDYLFVNLVADPDALIHYSPTAMNDSSQAIILFLQDPINNTLPVCDINNLGGSPVDSLCYSAATEGWWNADQMYMYLDDTLAANLSQLYNRFNIFAKAAEGVLDKTTIPVTYTSIDINYTENINNIDDLVASGKPITQLYLSKGDDRELPSQKVTVPLDSVGADGTYNSYYSKQLTDASFSTSTADLRELFHEIIKASGQTTYKKLIVTNTVRDDEGNITKIETKKSDVDLDESVDSLLVDGMQFQYAQYLNIIYSLTYSAWQSYAFAATRTGYDPSNGCDVLTNDDKPACVEANKLVNQVIVPVIQLFNFFVTNNVSFAGNKGQPDPDAITDPAQTLLDELFAQIGTSTDEALPGTLLAQIYNIGMPVTDSEGNEIDSFATQNFSMVQQIQSVGLSLIEGSINSMMGVFGNAKGELDKIRRDALIQSSATMAATLGLSAAAAIGSANVLGTGTNTYALYTATQNALYAGLMYRTTMQLASFSLSMMWLPLVIFVLSTMFTIGVSFSLVIPLIPFMLFWAGKTAWLLLVIEAMVAAPFVALGMVYPEGHQVFGKSQPAIDIVLGLVLRPVFMILGMIFGIGLTYVVIEYSAVGFHAIIDAMLSLMPVPDGSDSATYARGVLACLTIFLYATFLTLAFGKCFSLIYVIPDKVLSWIGNNRQEQAGASDVQEMKQSSAQTAQGGAQAGGQSASQGIEAHKQHTQSAASGEKEIMQGASSAGYSGGQVGREEYNKSEAKKSGGGAGN